MVRNLVGPCFKPRLTILPQLSDTCQAIYSSIRPLHAALVLLYCPSWVILAKPYTAQFFHCMQLLSYYIAPAEWYLPSHIQLNSSIACSSCLTILPQLSDTCQAIYSSILPLHAALVLLYCPSWVKLAKPYTAQFFHCMQLSSYYIAPAEWYLPSYIQLNSSIAYSSRLTILPQLSETCQAIYSSILPLHAALVLLYCPSWVILAKLYTAQFFHCMQLSSYYIAPAEWNLPSHIQLNSFIACSSCLTILPQLSDTCQAIYSSILPLHAALVLLYCPSWVKLAKPYTAQFFHCMQLLSYYIAPAEWYLPSHIQLNSSIACSSCLTILPQLSETCQAIYSSILPLHAALVLLYSPSWVILAKLYTAQFFHCMQLLSYYIAPAERYLPSHIQLNSSIACSSRLTILPQLSETCQAIYSSILPLHAALVLLYCPSWVILAKLYTAQFFHCMQLSSYYIAPAEWNLPSHIQLNSSIACSSCLTILPQLSDTCQAIYSSILPLHAALVLLYCPSWVKLAKPYTAQFFHCMQLLSYYIAPAEWYLPSHIQLNSSIACSSCLTILPQLSDTCQAIYSSILPLHAALVLLYCPSWVILAKPYTAQFFHCMQLLSYYIAPAEWYLPSHIQLNSSIACSSRLTILPQLSETCQAIYSSILPLHAALVLLYCPSWVILAKLYTAQFFHCMQLLSYYIAPAGWYLPSHIQLNSSIACSSRLTILPQLSDTCQAIYSSILPLHAALVLLYCPSWVILAKPYTAQFFHCMQLLSYYIAPAEWYLPSHIQLNSSIACSSRLTILPQLNKTCQAIYSSILSLHAALVLLYCPSWVILAKPYTAQFFHCMQLLSYYIAPAEWYLPSYIQLNSSIACSSRLTILPQLSETCQAIYSSILPLHAALVLLYCPSWVILAKPFTAQFFHCMQLSSWV